jgi:hypothetical protein
MFNFSVLLDLLIQLFLSKCVTGAILAHMLRVLSYGLHVLQNKAPNGGCAGAAPCDRLQRVRMLEML